LQAISLQCLEACYVNDKWRPTHVSDEVLNLVFLARTERTVDRGRIRINKRLYEAEELRDYQGRRVTLRYDPLDMERLLVFLGREYLGDAVEVERSSMRDRDLAARKIEAKRAARARYLQQYRALTSKSPDFRVYSTVPEAERAAALVGDRRREQAAEREERLRLMTTEELNARVRQMEEYAANERPVFATATEHYRWVLDRQSMHLPVQEADVAFVAEFEAAMDVETVAYWRIYKEGIGLIPISKGANDAPAPSHHVP
jgi:hypothetical protein